MSRSAVPDAWDDDWDGVADTVEKSAPPPESAPKLSKAQRRAQHLEQQKQLWDSAENPDRLLWLEAKGVVPLKQEYKPPVTLLSRKPNPPTIARREDPANGVAGMTLEDDEDSEEEARRKRTSELEERTRKAKIEREEKQRKYAEARERIMGPSSAGQSTPSGAATQSRESSHGRDNRRLRGNLNGSLGGRAKNNSQPTSADQSPSRPANGSPTLFDPDDMGGDYRGERPAKRPISRISQYDSREDRRVEEVGMDLVGEVDEQLLES